MLLLIDLATFFLERHFVGKKFIVKKLMENKMNNQNVREFPEPRRCIFSACAEIQVTTNPVFPPCAKFHMSTGIIPKLGIQGEGLLIVFTAL